MFHSMSEPILLNSLFSIRFNSDVKLLQAVDPRKDQTFFLSQIPQSALQRTMFPVGSMLKSQVKQLAHEIGLESIAQKRESTGICFIGKRKFSDFLSEYVDPKPGNFVDIDSGAIVGQHNGIHNYTIGQGVSVSGQQEKLFAVRKMPDNTTILVAAGTHHPSMYFDLFYTNRPHWIDQTPFDGIEVAKVEFRFQHGHKLESCRLVKTENGLLVMPKPVRAICAGQYAVFYSKNECLGSAKIEATGPFVRRSSEEKNEFNIIVDKECAVEKEANNNRN